MSPHHREDESLDESQVKIDRRMRTFRIFVGLIAVLLVLGGIVWVAQMVGLLTAVLPAGPGFLEGWLWGMLGVLGVILLGAILLNTRRET
jgi:hypothetical protein